MQCRQSELHFKAPQLLWATYDWTKLLHLCTNSSISQLHWLCAGVEEALGPIGSLSWQKVNPFQQIHPWLYPADSAASHRVVSWNLNVLHPLGWYNQHSCTDMAGSASVQLAEPQLRRGVGGNMGNRPSLTYGTLPASDTSFLDAEILNNSLKHLVLV